MRALALRQALGERARSVTATPLERALRERIASEGPITVEAFMEACNAYYYATRDPLGANGDPARAGASRADRIRRTDHRRGVHGSLQRILLRDPRSAWSERRLHDRAGDQPDVRRDDRRRAGGLLEARRCSR